MTDPNLYSDSLSIPLESLRNDYSFPALRKNKNKSFLGGEWAIILTIICLLLWN